MSRSRSSKLSQHTAEEGDSDDMDEQEEESSGMPWRYKNTTAGYLEGTLQVLQEHRRPKTVHVQLVGYALFAFRAGKGGDEIVCAHYTLVGIKTFPPPAKPFPTTWIDFSTPDHATGQRKYFKLKPHNFEDFGEWVSNLDDLAQVFKHPFVEGILRQETKVFGKLKVWKEMHVFCWQKALVVSAASHKIHATPEKTIPLAISTVSADDERPDVFVVAHEAYDGGTAKRFVFRTDSVEQRDHWVTVGAVLHATDLWQRIELARANHDQLLYQKGHHINHCGPEKIKDYAV